MLFFSLILLSVILLSNSERDVGTLAKRKEYPFITFIGESNQMNTQGVYKCAGIIVSEYWVLTLAQCVMDYRNKHFVPSNIADLFVTLHSSKERLSKVIIHPSYSTRSFENDVAMLKLLHHIKHSRHVQVANISRPICGGNGPTDLFYKSCILINKAGDDKYTGKEENIVSAPVQLISINKCQSVHEDKIFSNDICNISNICTYNENSDNFYPFTCDYGFILGSPLYCGPPKYGDVHALLLQRYKNSFCGTTGKPEVYVKVAQHAKWINQVISHH